MEFVLAMKMWLKYDRKEEWKISNERFENNQCLSVTLVLLLSSQNEWINGKNESNELNKWIDCVCSCCYFLLFLIFFLCLLLGVVVVVYIFLWLQILHFCSTTLYCCLLLLFLIAHHIFLIKTMHYDKSKKKTNDGDLYDLICCPYYLLSSPLAVAIPVDATSVLGDDDHDRLTHYSGWRRRI